MSITPQTPTARVPVLDVDRLTVDSANYRLLTDVTFTIGSDERVGLIGESGSGKSLTALSIIGLLPRNLTPRGSVTINGAQIVGEREKDIAKHRGNDVTMVFQEPMTALNPTMKIGEQIAEIMRIHHTQPSKRAARAQAVRLLEQVGLPNPAATAHAYPHQISGGQRQRVVVAIALANDPSLLICDEPTTALDVTVQAQVLELIRSQVDQHDSALLFITHDLAVVALMCQRVLVMYGGRIVESGAVHEVFTKPRHPYTAGLLGASDMEKTDEKGHLSTIPGSVPSAGRFPQGCVFANRCAFATEVCSAMPPWTDRSGQILDVSSGDSGFACHHPLGEGVS